LEANIHESSIIGKSVDIGDNVKIGPFCVIEDNVSIGDNTVIKSHVTINEYVKIGRDNKIFSHADIGGLPQDLKFKNKESWLEIGNKNTIREYVTIHRSSKKDEKTIIGDRNFLMAYTHVAHDCVLGNDIIIVNYSGLSGHVEVEDKAFLSGGVLVHQFVKIGSMAMIGGASRITQDVLPYSLVSGNPPRVYGLNVVGLRRNRKPKKIRDSMKKALSISLDLKNKEKIIKEITNHKIYEYEEIKHYVKFLEKSNRGILIRKNE